MALNKYSIIKGPVISPKAYKLNLENKVVLIVDPRANAPMIKEAVERLFNVKVLKVNTLYRTAKAKKIGRKVIPGGKTKRAYVTLAKGYKINFFDQTTSGVEDAMSGNKDTGKE